MKRNRSRICNVVHVIGIYNFSLSLALTASASFYNTEKMWYILLDISVSSQINKIHSGANTHRRKVSHVFRLFSQCKRLSKTSEQKKFPFLCFWLIRVSLGWQIYCSWPDWLAAICQLSICRPVSLAAVLGVLHSCALTSDDLLVFARLCRRAFSLDKSPAIDPLSILSDWPTGDKHFMT